MKKMNFLTKTWRYGVTILAALAFSIGQMWGAAQQRYIYVGISSNYQTYKTADEFGFNFWGGTSAGVKSGTYLTTYEWDSRTYYMYRVQVYDDNNKAQFKGNANWWDPSDGFSVTLNGTTKNAIFFSSSSDGWQGQFQQNYQVTSTASLAASSASITISQTATLTPSLSSNTDYNEIKSTSYEVTTNPGSAGSVTAAGVFSATAAGTYTVTATVTYNAKGFSGITKTATATKSITVNTVAETTHSVSLTYVCASPSATVAPAASQTVGEVTAESITAPTVAGYTFVNWTLGTGISNQSENVSANPISVKTLASGAYTMQANYTEDLSTPFVLRGGKAFGGNSWDVEFPLVKKAGHSTESVGYLSVSIAGTNNVANTDNDAYKFKIVNGSTWWGLPADGDSYWFLRTTTEKTMSDAKDIQLRADVVGEYEIKVDYTTPAEPKITVSFPEAYELAWNANGGNALTGTYTSGLTAVGATITKPNDPTRTGYTFAGWAESAEGEVVEVPATMPAAAKTYYAKWTIDTYTVTFNANGHGTAPDAAVVNYGAKVVAPTAPEAEGYAFGGWYREAGCTNAWDFANATITQDTTLYAKWTKLPVRIAGKGYYADLGAAITAAEADDEIIILESFEQATAVTINKALTIRGEGEGVTVTRGSARSQIFMEVSASATIKNLTITGKETDKSAGVRPILFKNASSAITIVVDNVTFSKFGNNNDLNGVIEVADKVTDTLRNVSFVDCQVKAGSGDVAIKGGSSNTRVAGTFSAPNGVYLQKNKRIENVSATYSVPVKLYFATDYVHNYAIVTKQPEAGASNFSIQTAGWYPNWVNTNGGEIHAMHGTKITLDKNSGETDGSAIATYGSSTLSNIVLCPERAGCTLLGYYAEEAGTTKVLDATGALQANVSGFTDADGKWIYETTVDLTLYAKWEVQANTVAFNMQGHGEAIASLTNVEYGSKISAPTPAPTAEGYTFGGWYKEPACANAWDFANDVVNEATTLYAKWTANKYTITFNTAGGSEVASITQDYGTAITAPTAPTKAGYTFTGWDPELPETMPAENMSLTAVWTIAQFTITFDTDGGTEVAAITQNYNSAIVAPAAPTKTGYTFAAWDPALPETMPAENKTLTAKWTEVKVAIVPTVEVAVGQPEFTATASVANIGIETTSVLTASAPTTGYKFAGWTLSENLVVVTGDKTKDLSITVRTNGDGEAVTAVAKYAEDLSTSWTLKGTFVDDFATAYDFVKRAGESTGSVAYAKLTLAAATTYKFQVIEGGSNWRGNTGTMTSENCTDWTFEAGYQNDCGLTTTIAGDYTFKIDFSGANPKVSVIYPIGVPVVKISTFGDVSYAVNTTQLFLTGYVTDDGMGGAIATKLDSVGFVIGDKKYTMACKDGDDKAYFWGYITGLEPGKTYSVKAFADNRAGQALSDAAEFTTRAAGTHIIKVQVGSTAAVPKIYAWAGDDACSGVVVENHEWPGVSMGDPVITGSKHKWYAYELSNEFNQFVICQGETAEAADATQTKDIANTFEDQCFWYWAEGETPADRSAEMACPYLTPQLMIGHVPGNTDEMDYLEMSIDGESINKTVTLVADTVYKFKPVYNAEWYGKSETTILTRAAASATQLLADDGGDLWVRTDIAGDYTFVFNTADKSVTVTYPQKTPTAIDETEAEIKAVKFLHNGQMFIRVNGVVFDASGRRVE